MNLYKINLHVYKVLDREKRNAATLFFINLFFFIICKVFSISLSTAIPVDITKWVLSLQISFIKGIWVKVLDEIL